MRLRVHVRESTDEFEVVQRHSGRGQHGQQRLIVHLGRQRCVRMQTGAECTARWRLRSLDDCTAGHRQVERAVVSSEAERRHGRLGGLLHGRRRGNLGQILHVFLTTLHQIVLVQLTGLGGHVDEIAERSYTSDSGEDDERAKRRRTNSQQRALGDCDSQLLCAHTRCRAMAALAIAT